MYRQRLALRLANKVWQEDGGRARLDEAIVAIAQDALAQAPVTAERAAVAKKWLDQLIGEVTLNPLDTLQLLVDTRHEVEWIIDVNRRSASVDGLVGICASMPSEEVDGYLAMVMQEVKGNTTVRLLALKTSNGGT